MKEASTSSQKKVKSKKRYTIDPELDRLDSLPWNSTLPQQSNEDDAFSFFTGTNELEGGFLTLEEIDETEYGLDIPEPENHNRKHNSKPEKKLKKQKQEDGGGDGDGNGACSVGETVKDEEDENSKVKKKKKKKKKNKDAKENQNVELSNAG